MPSVFLPTDMFFPTTLKGIRRHSSDGQTVEPLKESRSLLSQVYTPKSRRSEGIITLETGEVKCKYWRAR